MSSSFFFLSSLCWHLVRLHPFSLNQTDVATHVQVIGFQFFRCCDICLSACDQQVQYVSSAHRATKDTRSIDFVTSAMPLNTYTSRKRAIDGAPLSSFATPGAVKNRHRRALLFFKSFEQRRKSPPPPHPSSLQFSPQLSATVTKCNAILPSETT